MLVFLEYKIGNSKDYETPESEAFFGKVDKYESVTEEDSRIGDIIMYKLSENSENELLKHLTYDDTKRSLKEERHFSVIVLKDKKGKAPIFILQKNGDSYFDFKVDSASDVSLPGTKAKYVPATPKGASSPINRRKSKN